MKRLFIFLSLLTILFVAQTDYKARAQVQAKIFNVKAFRQGSDGSNDQPALKRAVAALNGSGSGGTLFFSDANFTFTVGQPGVDTNYSSFTGGTLGLLADFTRSNSSVVMSPQTNIKVVANYLCQNLTGQFAPCQQGLFGSSNSTITNLSILGQGATIDFKTDTENGSGVAATRCTVLNCANEFYTMYGNYITPLVRDFETTNFPRNVANNGGTPDASGNTLNFGKWENLRFTNWGGGGHDMNGYMQGGNLLSKWKVITNRPFHSHSVYFGAGKPYNTIRDSYFEWITPDAFINNKYHVQSFSTGAAFDVSDITIDNCIFKGAIVSLLFQHDLGTQTVRRISVLNSSVYGDGTNNGIYAPDCSDCTFSNNYFENLLTGLSVPNGVKGTGQNTILENNKAKTVKSFVSIGTGQSDSKILKNFVTAPIANGILFSIAGPRAKVISNTLYNAGSASAFGLLGSGANAEYTDNTFYSDNGVAYSELYDISGAGYTFSRNVINTSTSNFGILAGSDFKISENTSTERMIVAAGVTGQNLFVNNTFTGTRGKPNIRGNTYWYNNTCPNGVFGSGSEVAGYLNGKGNIFASGEVDTETASNGTTYTLHAGLYNRVFLTLTGNVTIAAPTNPTVGQTITFSLLQDATGSRTVTWNAVFIVSCSVTGTASTKTKLSFTYDGTNWVQDSQCLTAL